MESGTLYTGLSLADLEAHDERGGTGGRWCCPIDSPEGCRDKSITQAHRSLEIYDQDAGKWQCHRCHHYGTLKEKQAAFVPKSRREREAEKKARKDKKLAEALAAFHEPEVKEIDPQRFTGLKARIGKLQPIESDASVLRVLAERGFKTPEALELLHAAGVRHSQTFGNREATEEKPAYAGEACVVFPVRDIAGQLVAAQGRYLSTRQSGRRFQTEGDRQAGLFCTPGAIDALEEGLPVALVEAPFDALSLSLAGLPAFATCGTSGVPDWFIDRAFGRTFLLAHDNDSDLKGKPAGDKAAETIGGQLASLGATVRRFRPLAYKDWNDVLKAQGIGGLREVVNRELGVSEKPAQARTRPNPGLDGTGAATDTPGCVESQNLPVPGLTGDGETGRQEDAVYRLTVDRETELSILAAEMEAEWYQQAREAQRAQADTTVTQWWAYWRQVLVIAESLPPVEVKLRQGVTVSSVALWLRLALDRCRAHERLHGGPAWFYAPFGFGILPDFARMESLLFPDSHHLGASK